jgi:hypothetical protein
MGSEQQFWGHLDGVASILCMIMVWLGHGHMVEAFVGSLLYVIMYLMDLCSRITHIVCVCVAFNFFFSYWVVVAVYRPAVLLLLMNPLEMFVCKHAIGYWRVGWFSIDCRDNFWQLIQEFVGNLALSFLLLVLSIWCRYSWPRYYMILWKT